MKISKCSRGLAALIVCGGFSVYASNARGQSRSSAAIVGVTNPGNPGIIPLEGGDTESDTGDFVSAAASQSFTGQDRTGATQTMNFSGTATASSQYGQLHIYASGNVTNSYYNANNAPYDSGTGSPATLASLTIASFDDTLQFGGAALQNGYKARYVFHIDGTQSGYGMLTDLDVKIASDADELYFNTDTGATSANFATIDHEINGSTPQSIHAQFSNQFVLDTSAVNDGSNLSGVSNFSDTATLEAVTVVDADGNPVSGVTYTAASGTVYPTPEPATISLAAPLLLGALRRRRR